MPFELRRGSIVIPVRYGKGQVLRHFLLDNSRPCAVSPKIHREGGVMPLGLNGDVSYGRINELRLGDTSTVVFREIGAGIEPPTGAWPECWFDDVDGIIGGNLMRMGCWHISYADRRITFSSEPMNWPQQGIFTSFSTNTTNGEVKLDQPIVVNSLPVYDVLLQLNSRLGLAMPNAAISTLRSRHQAPVLRVRGTATQIEDTLMVPGKTLVSRADSLKLAGLPLGPALIQNLDRSTRFSIMGSRLLSQFDVYIDYMNQELALVRRQAQPDHLLESTGMTLLYVKSLKQVRVAMLFDLGSAAGAGLQPGDIVESIDGQPFTGADSDYFCALAKEMEILRRYEGMLLGINRGGRRFTVRVEKTRLL